MSESVVVADLRHMTAAWDASPRQVLIRALPRFLLEPRFRVVVFFRVSQVAWRRRSTRGVARWLQARAIRAGGAEIHPGALIGPGLCLVHSVGVVVGHEVVAGSNLVLYQGITLGHDGRTSGQPTLGDRVRVYAGAKVLGPISIGDEARIGANAIVLSDVPAGATVTGLWKQ